MLTKPLLPWKSKKYYIFVCVCVCVCVRARARAGVCLRACRLTYPVWNAHAPDCPQPLWLHHICQHYLITGAILGKTYWKNVLWFFLYILFEIFRIPARPASYCHQYENVFMQSTRYSCNILTKLEFSRHILENGSNIKFYQNPSSGSWIVPCGWIDGRTDRQTWCN